MSNILCDVLDGFTADDIFMYVSYTQRFRKI